MATSYARTSYDTIMADVLEEVNEDNATAGLSPESIYKWILHACARITERIAVQESFVLRLITGVEDYLFANTDTPITGSGTVDVVAGSNAVTGDVSSGTGTITSSGTTVTGSGTAFHTELAVGNAIIATINGDTEVRVIQEIHSNTELVLEGGFSEDVDTGISFTFCTTKFEHELAKGSTIIVNSESRVVASITDSYNLMVDVPFDGTASDQTFTIDRKVTEIPSRFSMIKYLDRQEGSYYRMVPVVEIGGLLRLRKEDRGFNSYTNINTPYCAAPWVDGSNRRFLKVYPAPESNKDMTAYGLIRIVPEEYTGSLTGSTLIPLRANFDSTIRDYVKMRIYGWLKQHELRQEHELAFERSISRLYASVREPIRKEVIKN